MAVSKEVLTSRQSGLSWHAVASSVVRACVLHPVGTLFETLNSLRGAHSLQRSPVGPVLKDTGKKGTEWQKRSLIIRGELDMLPAWHPWTTSPCVNCFGLGACPREHDIVNVAWWDWKRRFGTYIPQDQMAPNREWFVDVSQAIERRPWGETIHTKTKTSKVYSFSLDRVLTVEDSGTQQQLRIATRARAKGDAR